MTGTDIIVTPRGPEKHGGALRFGTHRARCALGAAGVTAAKKEGDKKTPLGRFALRRIWYRPDRLLLPPTALEKVKISHKCGWSDDTTQPDYNCPITRPYRHAHETLWRRDRLYDVFIELGYNDAPPEKGQGSAIFLHLEKNNFAPTLGCVAVRLETMDFLLRQIKRDTHICITDKR